MRMTAEPGIRFAQLSNNHNDVLSQVCGNIVAKTLDGESKEDVPVVVEN